METQTSKGKEIRIPGPDHPIAIFPAEGKVRVTDAEKMVAESTRAIRLEEKGYPPYSYSPRKILKDSFQQPTDRDRSVYICAFGGWGCRGRGHLQLKFWAKTRSPPSPASSM